MGYVFLSSDIREKADEEGALARAFLQDLAKEYHIHLVGGSIARRHEDGIYNTTYIVDRDGALVSSYDKCHLFTPGKEDKLLRPEGISMCFPSMG